MLTHSDYLHSHICMHAHLSAGQFHRRRRRSRGCGCCSCTLHCSVKLRLIEAKPPGRPQPHVVSGSKKRRKKEKEQKKKVLTQPITRIPVQSGLPLHMHKPVLRLPCARTHSDSACTPPSACLAEHGQSLSFSLSSGPAGFFFWWYWWWW